MRTHATGNCWIVRDLHDCPWDDEWDAHHDTREEADAAITEIREDWGDDGMTPEQEAELVANLHGEAAGANALIVARRRAEVLASLHPVELPGPCYRVSCDGPNCLEEPEGEYGGHLHFGPPGEFDAPDWEWRTVAGKDFCDDCKIAATCGECDGLAGDGSWDRDGMCVECWAKDQYRPVDGQETIPAQVAE